MPTDPLGAAPTGTPASFDSGPLTSGQRRIALTAIGGYFVDGYDLLVLGGALLGITPELGLTPVQLGLVTAMAFIGMAVGSPLSGPLTDRFGRKPIFFTSMMLFILASVGFLAVTEVVLLIALRFLVGLAIGADMPPSAALITEFIPARRRGTFTALGGVAWMLGGLCAIGVTIAIYTATGNDGNWRWVLASGALPALVLLFLRHRTPESPYWLLSRGRREDAVTAWRYAQGEHSGTELPGATLPTRQAGGARRNAPVSILFRRPFVLLLVCLSVYWGFNNLYGSALLLYQPTLISRIVTPESYTTLLFTAATTGVAVILGFIVCLYVIESIGRRFIALSGTGLFAVASVAIYVGIDNRWVVLAAFAVAIGVINGGTSLAYYSWAPELFPTRVRGRAVGIVNMVGKSGSVLGTLALPTVYDAIGEGIFIAIAVAALINLTVVYFMAPETKGKSLADLEGTGETRVLEGNR